jgi:hypothetical protein
MTRKITGMTCMSVHFLVTAGPPGPPRDEDDHQHLGAIRRGGAVVAREVRRHVHVRGHSVETELVALDVLHHEARLVVAIGRQ